MAETKNHQSGDDKAYRDFTAIVDEVDGRHEVLFSEMEAEILECYDQLQDLRLQRTILETHVDHSSGRIYA